MLGAGVGAVSSDMRETRGLRHFGRREAAVSLLVMPGLDPGIHEQRPRGKSCVSPPLTDHLMDCRVKPGNDRGEPLERFALFARQ
jgi:hypothetical protein